ncbi:hypothetical protein QBE53_10490 [Vallitaleaceae bacterium 9-2]
MSYVIVPTTAENIVTAAEAVNLFKNGCTNQELADFLDIPLASISNSLEMSVQLGLLKMNSGDNKYYCDSMLTKHLATNDEKLKSSVIRILLEEFEPFKFFTMRLEVTGFVHIAAEQVKAFYSLATHRDEVRDTLTSLGTYARILVSEGAGLYKVNSSNEQHIPLLVVGESVLSRTEAEVEIRNRLGDRVCNSVSNTDVIEPLITSYLKIVTISNDPRGAILHAGNAFESFLNKFGDDNSVNMSGANGINAKIDRLSSSNKILHKHKFMSKYLGHIRNACNHGPDSDIGQAWSITSDTSVEYFFVVLSCIRDILNASWNIYTI